MATVSNALTGKGRVSQDLADRVRARAAQLGYVPSAAGRALKTGRSQILGLVMPDITHPVFPDFAKGLDAEADRRGYGILIADSRGSSEGQDKAIAQLIMRGVDGIILIPRRGTSSRITQIPTATISIGSDPAFTVAANHHQGGSLAAKAAQQLGHRNLLLLGDDPHSPVQRDRIDGMLAAMTAQTQARAVWAHDGFPDLKDAHRSGVTAVLCVSDLLALRVVTDAGRAGLRCPQDFSVIGFDNLPLSTAVRPALSTVTPDTGALAEHAVAYLDAAIRGDTPPAPKIIDMSLTLRESTGPIPAATHDTERVPT